MEVTYHIATIAVLGVGCFFAGLCIGVAANCTY